MWECFINNIYHLSFLKKRTAHTHRPQTAHIETCTDLSLLSLGLVLHTQHTHTRSFNTHTLIHTQHTRTHSLHSLSLPTGATLFAIVSRTLVASNRSTTAKLSSTASGLRCSTTSSAKADAAVSGRVRVAFLEREKLITRDKLGRCSVYGFHGPSGLSLDQMKLGSVVLHGFLSPTHDFCFGVHVLARVAGF
ncbi:unnamed protein product [Camellia sinensis]